MPQCYLQHRALYYVVNLDIVAELERMGKDYKQPANNVGQGVLRSQAHGHSHYSGTGQDGVAYLLHAGYERKKARNTDDIYRRDHYPLHEAYLCSIKNKLALPPQ